MENMIVPLLMYGLMAVLLVVLFGGPFWLHKRFRDQRDQEDFTLRWTESDATAGYRGAEREMRGRVELSSAFGPLTKVGFFLGLLGFLWTPIVLVGAASKVMPMFLVGIPGLLVSWSIFFSSRAVLKHGPAANAWLRATAVGEALLNVWVLAIVVLSTIARTSHDDATRGLIASFLWVTPSQLDTYTIPYSLDCAGIVSVGYALFSLAHAWMTLRACDTLDTFVRERLVVAG